MGAGLSDGSDEANFLMIGGNVSSLDYPAVRTSGTFTLQETPGRAYWFAYY